jgi:hypothetical protein
MMSLLAALLCVGIVLFYIIYLIAWFATRNRAINLGGKRK